jgi:hypothetical protein
MLLSSLILIGFASPLAAHGAENTFNDFPSRLLSLDNPYFANSSGNFPQSPSGWTSASYSNALKGSTVAGIIDIPSYNTEENIRTAKLNEYPEYKTGVPKLPFGPNLAYSPSDDKKILMINTTKSSETVYGYNSSSVD